MYLRKSEIVINLTGNGNYILQNPLMKYNDMLLEVICRITRRRAYCHLETTATALSLCVSVCVLHVLSKCADLLTVRNSSCGKVMFSQVSVCPQGRRCTPPGGHPLGRHPPGRQTDTPWADTPQADTPPQRQKATAADGTHPTGMHSCCLKNYSSC